MGWSQQLNGFSGAGGDGLPGVKTPHIDAMAHRCAAAAPRPPPPRLTTMCARLPAQRCHPEQLLRRHCLLTNPCDRYDGPLPHTQHNRRLYPRASGVRSATQRNNPTSAAERQKLFVPCNRQVVRALRPRAAHLRAPLQALRASRVRLTAGTWVTTSGSTRRLGVDSIRFSDTMKVPRITLRTCAGAATTCMYVRDRSVVFLSFFLSCFWRADTVYAHVSCAQRDIGPRCGEGCSRSPDLRGTYSVNIYSAEAVARIHQHAGGSSPWLIYLAYQSIRTI
eukprot:COSAG01_NODE_2596_length_7401_cov_12.151055_10_plen_279_part_00